MKKLLSFPRRVVQKPVSTTRWMPTVETGKEEDVVPADSQLSSPTRGDPNDSMLEQLCSSMEVKFKENCYFHDHLCAWPPWLIGPDNTRPGYQSPYLLGTRPYTYSVCASSLLVINK